MSAIQYSDAFKRFAEDVHACRLCRDPNGSEHERAFALAVGDPLRPPEIHDGPERVDLLIVGINPRLWQNAPPVTDTVQYLDGSRTTLARDKGTTLRGDRYVKAIQDSLPDGYSWWNKDARTIGNTRMCKCPTLNWSRAYNWAADACAQRFLSRELSLTMPKAFLVLGVASWQVVLPRLGIPLVPTSPGPHSLTARLGEQKRPLVAAHHLTRKSGSYRLSVRDALKQALDA